MQVFQIYGIVALLGAATWVGGVHAQAIQSDDALNTLRSQSISSQAKLAPITADIQRIKDCANQGKFYVDGVCKAPSLDADALPPKAAGLVVKPVAGGKTHTWYGSCVHGNIYCSVSCKDGKTAWVEMVNGQYQPYYCPAITSASGESTCAQADRWGTTGAAKNCWKGLTSDAQASTVIYTDAWGNNAETITGQPSGI